MENRAHALIAGLFLLLLGTALVAVTMWFAGGRVDRIPAQVVTTAGVPGLVEKAVVKLRGVEVGSVESIDFDPVDRRRIVVRIAVDRSAPLTRATFARLSYQGVTGLTYIDLADRGDDPTPLAAVPEADRRIELQPPVLEQLASAAPALLAALTDTVQRLNQVLSPQNQGRVEHLLDRADAALEELGARVRELQPAVAAAGPLAGELSLTVKQARSAAEGLNATSERIGELAVDLRQRLPMIDRLGEASLRLGLAADAIGRGIVGERGAGGAPLLESMGQAARSVDRAAAQWAEQPQSVVFGRSPSPPGPGERGFDPALSGR